MSWSGSVCTHYKLFEFWKLSIEDPKPTHEGGGRGKWGALVEKCRGP